MTSDTERDDGGAAFPRPVSEDRTSGDQIDGNRTVREQSGLSLRDYFAAAALQSIPLRAWEKDGKVPDDIFAKWAHAAYATADAMLRARTGEDTK
jgi:hypothetical protein